MLLQLISDIRRVWRYQSGNQNLYIEEEQPTQWPKEKGQKDKQWSTKHTHKTKDIVSRTPLKTEGERRYSGMVSSSCSTGGNRRVAVVTNLVISHEWGTDRRVLRQVEHIRDKSVFVVRQVSWWSQYFGIHLV